VFGKRAAVDGHEWSLVAWRELVDGVGEVLLARAGLAQQQHRGLALGHLGQDAQDVQHVGVARAEALGQLAAAFAWRCGEVAEAFHPADDIAELILEGRCAHAHRHLHAVPALHYQDAAHDLAVLGDALFQHAMLAFAPDAALSAEDLPAFAAHGLVGADAHDACGALAEVDDVPLAVHGEQPVGHGVHDEGAERGAGEGLPQGVVHGFPPGFVRLFLKGESAPGDAGGQGGQTRFSSVDRFRSG